MRKIQEQAMQKFKEVSLTDVEKTTPGAIMSLAKSHQ